MTPSHPLAWQQGFTCGVAEIDEQHQILVDLLNVAAVRRRSEPGVEMVRRLVMDFLDYALFHFETEEFLMQCHGYAESEPEEATRHLEQHRLASLKMAAARDTLRAGETVPLDELIGFLREWLEQHIPGTDLELCAFLRKVRDMS